MGICNSSLMKELYIRVGFFRRCQRVRVRGKYAKQVPGKLFKFAFLVDLMGLMRYERFVYQRCERSPSLGDRFVNVLDRDGNDVFLGLRFEIHVVVNGY